MVPLYVTCNCWKPSTLGQRKCTGIIREHGNETNKSFRMENAVKSSNDLQWLAGMVKSQYVGFAFDGCGGNKKLVNSLALPTTLPATLQQMDTLDAPQKYSHGEPNSTSTPLISPYISSLIGPSLMPFCEPSSKAWSIFRPNSPLCSSECTLYTLPLPSYKSPQKTTNHHTLCESLKSDP